MRARSRSRSRARPVGARLLVEDDGRGFDAARAAREGHFGVWLLHDLARAAGGRAEIESEPGRGTRVRVEVPLR
ncbi:MAG TPA: ATP-binding protein [Thermoleophilaceae bacterium]|nr:ATP-binding protein [Thermoleophilaceae bacterium]